MIFCVDVDGNIEYPVSFDELKARFPKTMFCDPIKQTALPEGYHIAELALEPPFESVPNFEQNKKQTQGQPFKTESGWKFNIVNVDPTEKELEEAKLEVDKKVMKSLGSIRWAFDDSSIPESLIDKYKEIKKQLLAVYEQDGYPFHVKYPEVE